MSKTIRYTLIGLALAALGLPAAGCGAGSASAEGPVRFLVFGEPEELKAFRNVARAYEQEQPGVDVRLIEASDRDDLLARLSTSIAAGQPPDLFLLNYRFYGQFAARGVLEPIQDRVDDSDAFDQDDFYAPALDAFRFEGTLTCLPQNISSLVVYYNRKLFRAAGVAEPEAGWTWNDMVEKAVALTEDTDSDGRPEVYGVGVEASIIRLAPFVWSNGGEIVDDVRRPTRFTLDTPEAREAMRAFFELRNTHAVVPREEEVESEDDETRFANGRLAMVLSSRRSTPTFRTIKAFDWDVAPLPRHKEPAGILHSDAYCMTKGSTNKEAAWSFMEFALGEEGQRITARSGRTVPSLKSVANSEAFLHPDAKPRNSRVFLDGIPVIRRVPNISTWPEIEDATAGPLETGFYEGGNVEKAVAEIEQATTPIFARAE